MSGLPGDPRGTGRENASPCRFGHMYISGTMDAPWNNDVLNPTFRSLPADDFEVVQLG